MTTPGQAPVASVAEAAERSHFAPRRAMVDVAMGLRGPGGYTGLLAGLPRKNCWVIAEHAGTGRRTGCSTCRHGREGTRTGSATTCAAIQARFQESAADLDHVAGRPPPAAEEPASRGRSRRQADHAKQALEAALADLPTHHLRVIRDLCAPPRPLEPAVRGREVDDPDGFVSAVNAAARGHGIGEPVVEASAWTMRATVPRTSWSAPCSAG
jgi:hypothetical protein